jgi:hypothetical protein
MEAVAIVISEKFRKILCTEPCIRTLPANLLEILLSSFYNFINLKLQR